MRFPHATASGNNGEADASARGRRSRVPYAGGKWNCAYVNALQAEGFALGVGSGIGYRDVSLQSFPHVSQSIRAVAQRRTMRLS